MNKTVRLVVVAGLSVVLVVCLAGCSSDLSNPQIFVTASPTDNYYANATSYFTVTASHFGGFSRITLKCDFGDGTDQTESGANVNSDGTAQVAIYHIYKTPGTYTVKVVAYAGALVVPGNPIKVKIKENSSSGSCELMIIQPLVHGSGRMAKVIGSR